MVSHPRRVLGSKLYKELYGTANALGERIRVGGQRYRVVGIMESKGDMVGIDLDDQSVVVVTSTGIDIDLIPFAADARLRHDPRARLIVVVPERDAHAVTRDLAAALQEPAAVSTVPEGWREWALPGTPVP